MGISFSKRQNHHHQQPPQQNHHQHQQQPQQNQYNRPQPPPPLPPPTLPPNPPPLQSPIPPQTQPIINPYNYNNLNYYPRPPPPPPVNYNYNNQTNYATPYYNYNNNYVLHHHQPQLGGWGQPMMQYQHQQQQQQQQQQPVVIHPAPYVDHQHAKKVKNDVNVHKDTITLLLDLDNNNSYLLSFTFDALIDGSITISYFAKEGPLCKFTPVYPEIPPVKVPFKKGLGQKFVQPLGTGVDLGFFAVEDLSKPSPEDDIYPLVISAGASEPSTPIDEHSNEKLVTSSSHAQISQAILEQKDDKNFTVKVVKQILWIDGVRYELREIFGISNSNETTVSEVDTGKECVICMTEEKNTAVLPCRHMCMCSECAKQLRLQSEKCPVCRQPIKELIEIKVDDKESEI